jgi:carboxyl-terminal processing protease
MQISNSLEGIGAVLFKQDDMIVIRELVPGGPAALSGKLKSGDRIVGVGQGGSGEMKDVIGWRTDDAVELIRGTANTQVRLDIVSAEAPMDSKPTRVVLTRAKVRLEDARAKAETITLPAADGQPARRIGVIKLPGFYQDFEARRRNDDTYASASKDVERMLGEFRAQKMDGVVLDLRGNGGGSLTKRSSSPACSSTRARWCRCANPVAASAWTRIARPAWPGMGRWRSWSTAAPHRPRKSWPARSRITAAA